MSAIWKGIKNFILGEKSCKYSGIIEARKNLISRNGLLRCPFCGSEAELKHDCLNYYVECKNILCKAKTNTNPDEFYYSKIKNKDEYLRQLAIDTWNQNIPIEHVSDKYCPFCKSKDGFKIKYLNGNPIGIYCTYCGSNGPDTRYSNLTWENRHRRVKYNNIKTCPFCGGKAELNEYSNSSEIYEYSITCTDCYASTEKILAYGDSVKSAVDNVTNRWNECYISNEIIYTEHPCPFCGNKGSVKKHGLNFIGNSSLYCTYCGSCGPQNELTDACIELWEERFFEKYNIVKK